MPCSRALLHLATLLGVVLGSALIPGPARALQSGYVAQLTHVYWDEIGTGLVEGAQIYGEFEAYGCQQGDDFCFDYYGADPITGGYYYDFYFYALINMPDLVLHAENFAGYQDYGDTTVQNSEPGVGTDRFRLQAWTDWAVAEPDSLDDFDPPRWHVILDLQLIDADGTALTQGGVPDQLPDFEEFENSYFYILAQDPNGDEFQAEGVFVSLPEPSQVVLLVAGLPALLLLARRREERARSGA